MTPSRPLTHDLFKTFAETFNINVTEVIIYNLVEGIFYAKLICNDATQHDYEIDARTSDAIAVAVRFDCPIYTYEFILSSAGIVIEGNDFVYLENITETPEEITPGTGVSGFAAISTEELKTKLQEALTE